MKKYFIGAVIGVLTLILVGVIGTHMSYKTVPDLHDDLVTQPETIPDDTFSARVMSIEKSDIYGWGINVGDNTVIANFSRLGLHKGDKITFIVSGYYRIGDMYLINAKIYTK